MKPRSRRKTGGAAASNSATARASTSEPPIAPPSGSGPKRRKGDVVCSRCGAKPGDGVEWARVDATAAPEGGACAPCWKAFVRGWAHSEEWYDFCERLQDDGKASEQFDAAVKIVSGATPSFFPSEVSQATRARVQIKRSLVGIPRSDFVDMTGRGPEEFKLQMQDLRDENGATFKGILVRNPFRPWVEYDLIHEKDLTNMELKMPRDFQVRQQQGDEQWQHLVDSRGSEDKLFQRLKGCSQTMSSVGAKIGVDLMAAASDTYGWGNGKAKGRAKGASDNDSSDDSDGKARAPLQVRGSDGPCLAKPPLVQTPATKKRRDASPPSPGSGRQSRVDSRSMCGKSMARFTSAGGSGCGASSIMPAISPGQTIEAS